MNKYKVTVEVEARNAQEARRIVESSSDKLSNPHGAPEYMSELVNYGGTMVPRGYVFQKLIALAKAQGHNDRDAKQLADRWMQGYDLRHAQQHSNPSKSFAFERLNYASPQGQPAYQLYRSFGAKFSKADTVFGEQAVQGWRDFYTRKGWVEVAPPRA